jgi:hypothetical protein
MIENHEWKVLVVKFYANIFLEELRRTTKNLSQNTRPEVRESKPGTPE